MAATKTSTAWESVVRVVFPVRDADEVWPLYALDWTQPVVPETLLDPRIDMQQLDMQRMNQTQIQSLVRRSLAGNKAQGATNRAFSFVGRNELMVRVGARASLCTFFNAFPAAYWRRWTQVRTIRLVLEACGEGTVAAQRSNGRGLLFPAGTVAVNGDEWQRYEISVALTDMMDGGYCWFDVEAGNDHDIRVRNAQWQVPAQCRTAVADTSLSIAIATFNRPSYCLRQLETIAAEPQLRDRLDTVYCTDQGTDLVSQQEGFAAVQSELGPQLTYIRQRNLGGSGGFSRGMYETVRHGVSAYCLLLDDDAISEPEAILRAVQFADYTIKPTLVGGGMLHLDNRTMLYTQGERIDWRRMWMHPSLNMGYNHDFAAEPLRDTPARHQRIDEDFNGWWMCLIPVRVLEDVGLSLPVFIKFDDIEYGLRAKRAGYPTVCLPGVAVWHQAWHSKDPARGWEEYFTERNRWIAALLTQPGKPVSRVLFEFLYGDASLGLRFTYSAMALRHQALKDVMRGPAYIVDCLPTKLGEIRALRSTFEDAQSEDSFEAFPDPDHDGISPRLRPTDAKYRYRNALKLIAKSMVSRKDASKAERPDVAISAQDSSWTWLAFEGIDSALVTSPDGNSVTWLKRNDRQFRAYVREAYHLVRSLNKHWTRLSAQYRNYNLPSMETWERIFANDINVQKFDNSGDGSVEHK